MRLFVALNLPKKERDRIFRASKVLREGELPVSWVEPEHYHVTSKFLAEVQVDFPIVYGDMFDVMDISKEYGNSFGGLPFSTFVDRDGNMRYTQKPGEMTYDEAEEVLLRLLN